MTVVASVGRGSDGEAAAVWLKAFIDALPAVGSGRLEIRPHPRYQADLPALRQVLGGHPRVRFLDPSQEPILQTLGRTSLHLSIGSTCHYLAVSNGCPSIVLPGAGSRTADPLLADGSALPSTPAAAAALLMMPRTSAPLDRWMRPFDHRVLDQTPVTP